MGCPSVNFFRSSHRLLLLIGYLQAWFGLENSKINIDLLAYLSKLITFYQTPNLSNHPVTERKTMQTTPGTRFAFGSIRNLLLATAAIAFVGSSSADAATIVTWDAEAPDFASALVTGNSNTTTIEGREFNSNRAPAQGITVSETFVLDAIYIEIGDVLLFDTQFQLVLAPATFDSVNNALLADPTANLILDATLTTPASTNDPGNNVWVKFDIENITLTASPNPYALFLTSSLASTTMLVNRSTGNYLDLGQNRYFEQRNGNPKLNAPANGTADMRFALVAVPEPSSALLVALAFGAFLRTRRYRRPAR